MGEIIKFKEILNLFEAKKKCLALKASIFEWISSYEALIDIASKTLKEVAKRAVGGQVKRLCSSICIFLQKQALKQNDNINKINPEMAKQLTFLTTWCNS